MNLKPLLQPKSIAVVGASKDTQKLGHQIFANLKKSRNKQVKIYPINPKLGSILGIKAYPHISACPTKIDLAIYVIPAPSVTTQLASDINEINSAVVVSAGFSETGKTGQTLEQELAHLAHQHQLPLLGPNCLGIITPSYINASFSQKTPKLGDISFISQSGALGTALMDMLIGNEIGMSSFVSLGNKAVLDESDLLEYLGNDPATKQIALYLENIKNPEKFYHTTARISSHKPVMLLLGGTSKLAKQAIKSHTGQAASPAKIALASAQQYGAITINSLKDLLNLAKLFETHQQLLENDLTILTNAGGGGVLAVDSLDKSSLNLAKLSSATKSKLISILPPAASIGNPVDILGDATSKRLASALEVILNDKISDAVLIVLSPQTTTDYANIAKVIVKLQKQYPKSPIVTCFLSGSASKPAETILKRRSLPFYHFPLESIEALNHWFQYYQLRSVTTYPKAKKSHSLTPKLKKHYSVQLQAASNHKIVPLATAFPLLEKYGLNLAPYAIASNQTEVVQNAQKLGYPVALKTAVNQSNHKFLSGEIVTQIEHPNALKSAYRQISRIDKTVLVQKMIPNRFELFLGLNHLPEYGINLVFGTGGIYTNIFNDFAILHYPFNQRMAKTAIRRTKAFKALKSTSTDLQKITNTLVDWFSRISTLAIEFPQIRQIDFNPILYDGQDLFMIDIKIRQDSKLTK